MIEVSENLKSLIEADSRTFRVRIIHGKNTYKEIRTFKKTFMLPDSSMSVGNALCALIECVAEDVPVSIIGAEFEAEITVLGSDEWISLGKFKAERPTVQNGTVTFTAYDAMNTAANKTYVSTLSEGEHTVWEYFTDICGVVGVGCADIPDKKGSIVVPEDKLSGYSCRDALAYLAGFIGCNCLVNRQGLFEMKAFTLVDYSMLNGDKIAEPELSDSDSIIGYIACCVDGETTLQTGTGSDGFEFISPIMTQSQLDLIGTELMAETSPVRIYKAGSITQLLGDPRLEICDVVPLSFNGETYTIPIMSLVLDYDGGVQAEIKSFEFPEPNSLSLNERLDFTAKQAAEKATKYSEGALNFSSAIGNAMGLYQTAVTVGSGTIIYLHDKPTLSDSTYICCRTSEGFAVASSWGGTHEKTVWSSGFDREGNAILKMLTVYQINADHISAGSITTEKLAAKSVTADKIKVSDLSALNATIANWTIHSNLLYVPSLKQDDGTYSYGIGLSNTTVAFYAGYQSDDGTYKTTANHPGSPYEGGSFNFDKVNFYVTRAGKLVAKNAEISGKITSVSSDGKGKVVIDNGGFECYTTSPDGFLLKYGEIKAALDKSIDENTPAMCIRADASNSVGMILSAGSGSWYAMYKDEQEGYATGDKHRHSFYGNVWFKNSVFIQASVVSPEYYLLNNNNSEKYRIFRYQTSGNLQIGATAQPGHTSIYAKTGSMIYAMNNLCLATDTGIYTTINSSPYRVLYYGKVDDGTANGLTGLHIGVSGQSLYLWADNGATVSGNLDITNAATVFGKLNITRGIYTDDIRNFGVASSGNLLFGDSTQSGNTHLYAGSGKYIRTFNDLYISPDTGLYFYKSGDAWYRTLYYGTVNSLSGLHFGMQNLPIYFWASSMKTSSDTYIFRFGSDGALVFGDTAQASNTVLYAPSNGFITLTAGTVYSNANLRIGSGKGIYFYDLTDSAWEREIYYGSFVSSGTGKSYGCLSLGSAEDYMFLYGTSVLLNGSVSVTSDANLKKDISDLTSKHETMFGLLKPKSFKYIDGTSDRTHLGFIAQEVKEAIEDAGLTTQDVASYVELVNEDGSATLALRYEEFIALNTQMIQKCLSKISSLEDEINLLKETVNNG